LNLLEEQVEVKYLHEEEAAPLFHDKKIKGDAGDWEREYTEDNNQIRQYKNKEFAREELVNAK
jgi:hypothetical protein